MAERFNRIQKLYYDADPLIVGDRSGNVMSFENRYRLLEYVELRDARQNSRDAKILSIIAIFIALVALIMTIYFSSIQIQTPLKLDKKQIMNIYNEISKAPNSKVKE